MCLWSCLWSHNVGMCMECVCWTAFGVCLWDCAAGACLWDCVLGVTVCTWGCAWTTTVKKIYHRYYISYQFQGRGSHRASFVVRRRVSVFGCFPDLMIIETRVSTIKSICSQSRLHPVRSAPGQEIRVKVMTFTRKNYDLQVLLRPIKSELRLA